jgi:hypothetical protein
VALPRLFDELNLPAAHLINTTVFEYAPQIVDALKARGDEFIGHGRTNAERHGSMWEADEKRFLEEIRDAIEKASASGRAAGWRRGWPRRAGRPDLLKEVGFDFLMDWPNDDQPLWMKTRSGPLMSVPYPIEVNDSPQILVRHHSAEEFRDMIIGQFEELLRQSAKQPLVCGIALHTMIVGQPYRLRCLREALQHIANHPQKDKVWFTRPSRHLRPLRRAAQGTMVPRPDSRELSQVDLRRPASAARKLVEAERLLQDRRRARRGPSGCGCRSRWRTGKGRPRARMRLGDRKALAGR